MNCVFKNCLPQIVLVNTYNSNFGCHVFETNHDLVLNVPTTVLCREIFLLPGRICHLDRRNLSRTMENLLTTKLMNDHTVCLGYHCVSAVPY